MNGRAALIIIAVFFLSAVLVDPRGEFPLNDDWSYSRTAFNLAREGRIEVDPWSAPSLVGQALYGGLVARLFGSSFTVLRLSTLALSCGLAILLWLLLRQLGTAPKLAWIAVLGWIFNPIQFCLSFTFMTEIPFLFCVGSGLWFSLRYFQSERLSFLVASAIALGYASLIRQTAVLFLASEVLTILVWQRAKGWKTATAHAALACAAAAPFLFGYLAWRSSTGSTAAARRKFELLAHLTTEQLVGNFFGILFYAAVMLLPMILYLAPQLRAARQDSPRTFRRVSLASWIVLAGVGLCWFHYHYAAQTDLVSRAYHGRMPFLLNVLYDSGLGPVTLDPTYYGVLPTPKYPAAWWVVTLLSAAGVTLGGHFVTLTAANLPAMKRPRSAWVFQMLAAAALVGAFEIVFSHLQEGGLFDRHLLSLALPLTLALGACEAGQPRVKRRTISAAALWITALALFSVAATRDYLAWNRVRWALGNELLAQKVDPLTLSAGFEFNAWHNYDTFRRRGHIEKVYTWWYDSRDYLISLSPEPGYEILKRAEYFSWVHRRMIPVYALRKGTAALR